MAKQHADRTEIPTATAAFACCLLTAACLSGCAEMAAQQSALAEVQQTLEILETDVAVTHAAVLSGNQTSEAVGSTVETQLTQMQQQLAQLDTAIADACKAVAVPVPQSTTQDCPDQVDPVVMSQGDKLVLGEIETVNVVEPDFQIIARMDTGASSSSLHATNLVSFERDGDDWVRFDVAITGAGEATTVDLEKPVKKFVRVFQQADKEGSRRPVVELRIRLGNVQGVFEFTLADRSHLEHSMILGRNFLTDMAVVDVSQQFIQPGIQPASSD